MTIRTVARYLTTSPMRGAALGSVAGAVHGALAAEPGDTAGGTVRGALQGAALGGTAAGLGRAYRDTRLLNTKLTPAQRLRLASLLHTHHYAAGALVARENTFGNEMFIIKGGTLEVWLTPNKLLAGNHEPTLLATLQARQVVGELSLLDGAARSADLHAGPEGATLLALTDEALAKLAEDDPAR